MKRWHRHPYTYRINLIVEILLNKQSLLAALIGHLNIPVLWSVGVTITILSQCSARFLCHIFLIYCSNLIDCQCQHIIMFWTIIPPNYSPFFPNFHTTVKYNESSTEGIPLFHGPLFSQHKDANATFLSNYDLFECSRRDRLLLSTHIRNSDQ